MVTLGCLGRVNTDYPGDAVACVGLAGCLPPRVHWPVRRR